MNLLCLTAFLAIIPTLIADSLSSKADLDTLIHVHTVWRHGDRTPSILIPTDSENGIKTWPDGLGEITKIGLEQQYKLGELIRARYDGFLSKHYSPFEIYVRSSDYNRTLVSAQANLLAMYPPEDSELFLKSIRWRPIPVHTVPKRQDKELFDRAPCPNAEIEEELLYNSQIIKKIEEENHQTLLFIGEKSGYTKEGEPIRLRDVWKIFDPLWAEYNHQTEHKLPSWVNDTVREEIYKLYHISSSYLYGSLLLKRLRVGPLFGQILGRMEDRAIGYLDPREKIYAYSAHDTAVSALLSGFGITPVLFPEYATAAFVELHKINNSYVVEFFYKNDTHKDDIWQLDIPYCASPCTLQKLRDEARSGGILPNNWEEECGLYQVGFHHLYIYAIFTGGTFMLFMFLGFVRIYRRRIENPNECDTRNYRLLEEAADD